MLRLLRIVVAFLSVPSAVTIARRALLAADVLGSAAVSARIRLLGLTHCALRPGSVYVPRQPSPLSVDGMIRSVVATLGSQLRFRRRAA